MFTYQGSVAHPADGKPLPSLLLCVGLAVSLFGVSLVPSMDLDGAEHVLVGYLFVVPGSPYFLLAAAARHLQSERERKALIGAFAGVLPTILVYAPLLQEHPRSVDGPLTAGVFIYWLPLMLPVTAGIGVASALLWPTRTRAPTGADRHLYKIKLLDDRPVAWRSSIFLASLGIVVGIHLAMVAWLVYPGRTAGAHVFWAIVAGGPAFAVGLLAMLLRTRRAFHGLAGAFFGSLSAPLGLALLIVDGSDYRGGGADIGFRLAIVGPLLVVGAMALCSAAGRRWYRLQCGEPGRSLLASD